MQLRQRIKVTDKIKLLLESTRIKLDYQIKNIQTGNAMKDDRWKADACGLIVVIRTKCKIFNFVLTSVSCDVTIYIQSKINPERVLKVKNNTIGTVLA